MPDVSGETLTYALRMIWFGMLVTLDVKSTLMFTGYATPGMRQALLIKSCVLFGLCMAVMLVEFPTRGDTGEEKETA